MVIEFNSGSDRGRNFILKIQSQDSKILGEVHLNEWVIPNAE